MNIELQMKISNNQLIKKYLRENSYWYKILNRNPEKLDMMINDMKKSYKLNIEDKLENIADKIKMLRLFVDVFK